MESLVASDQGQRPAKHDTLHEADHHVPCLDRVGDVVPILGGGNALEHDRHEPTGERAAHVTKKGQQRRQKQARQEARNHQLAYGVGAHGPQGADLLGDAHGAQFGGQRPADPAGHHHARQHRPELLNQAQGHQDAHPILEAGRPQLVVALYGQHKPHKGARDHNHGQRSITHFKKEGHRSDPGPPLHQPRQQPAQHLP